MRDTPCRTCFLCGGTGRILHEGLQDRLFGVPGKWSFRLCDSPDCGLVWLDPKPLESDLPNAYASYYTHGNGEAATNSVRKGSRQRRIVRKLEQIWLALLLLGSARRRIDTMFLDDIEPGRMLEVGCGDGRLLAGMRTRGWDVAGHEIDPKAADLARHVSGVTVYSGDLIEIALPAESYDAIVMNHVIEHAYDPPGLAKECHRLLKPGGLFIVTTPNANSYGHERFGDAWMCLDPPRHLQIFSPKTLEQLATGSGFLCCRTWTTPVRAGGLLAASLDIERKGTHKMRKMVSTQQIVAAFRYQLAAKIAYIQSKGSGEEVVLLARR
ncbi:MAG: class I SAM-dependent methyltransferase [Dongiaceae bacterium]